MKKLILIDSNALVHRAFHALPPLSAPDGRPTNAVYGFTSVLLKMLNDLKPDYIAATFDLAGPTFRHLEYEDYKAHRERAPDELYAQIPMVKTMLKAFGIPIFELEGYEADDIIGTIAEQSKDLPDVQTVIVTGDLDTLQLVHGDTVVVFTLRKGVTDTVTYNEDAVRERYGLTPHQVPDFKGLKGDPSDNIPGVKGIGEKTASSLIAQFQSIEKMYEQLDRGEGDLSEKLRAKLVEQRDMALFSKKLATIVRTVPLEFTLEQTDWRKHADTAAIETTCKDLGLFSLAKRAAVALGAAPAQPSIQALDFDAPMTAPRIVVRPVATPDELPNASTAAVHALLEGEQIAKLWVTTDGETIHEMDRPTPEQAAQVLTNYQTVIGHDIKPLVRRLPDPSLLVGRTLVDTEVGAWLSNPDMRDYALERVWYDYVSETLAVEQEAWPLALWRLWPLIAERLTSFDLMSMFTDLEMQLLPVLATMEHRGIRVDTTTISDLLKLARTTVAELERTIWKMAGGEFNINSPAQLGEILFTKLAIKGRVRRTGGGAPSTAAAELEKLRDEHPIIELILQYREMAKLKTTYIEPFPALIAADGRIHTTYRQAGTATGRLSSSDPNLQNVPTRTELGQRFRAAFVADPGWKFVSLDYSQLELRLVAHIAHDATMIEAFRAGEDIHTRTASVVFGVAQAAVTKDMRRQAKVLNFGIIYGMGVLGFARAASIGRDQAKQFIDEYFTRFSGVATYMERTKKEAYEHGYVSTLLGRRRPLPDITSRMPQLAAAAERMAINHPIQGTGADLVKSAMLAVDRHIKDNGLTDRVRMLLQVHDELVMEIRTEDVVVVTEHLRAVMEGVYHLDVPLTVDAKVGDNWSAMEPIPRAT